MSSVQKTSMNILPLWTWNVCPTNSGTIVQALAHVRIGARLLGDCVWTFRNSFSSTNGPFLSDRDIASFLVASG